MSDTDTLTRPRRRADPPLDREPAARLRTAIARISRRLRPTIAGSGLTPSEISVLFTIVRLGPMRLSELADREAINPTMLSRITSQLCDSGLIVRSPDPLDRRAAIVRATPAGRRTRELIQRERTKALSAHISKLTGEQRRILEQALPVLEELAEQMGVPRP